jgi:hypothetical protein
MTLRVVQFWLLPLQVTPFCIVSRFPPFFFYWNAQSIQSVAPTSWIVRVSPAHVAPLTISAIPQFCAIHPPTSASHSPGSASSP